MENKLLSAKQRLFIEHLPEPVLSAFYLTGGTALSAFYMGHRLSEDLDLFTDAEESMPRVEFLTAFIKRLPGCGDIRYQRLFDRRIFGITFEDGTTLKVEFTTYPFESVEERKKFGKLTVDSLLNMITGKLFAMTDRFDPKDFVDVHFFFRTYDWKMKELILKTEDRFGIKGLDFLIPERLLMVKRIGPGDLPVMVKEMDIDEMKAALTNLCSDLLRSRTDTG